MFAVGGVVVWYDHKKLVGKVMLGAATAL